MSNASFRTGFAPSSRLMRMLQIFSWRASFVVIAIGVTVLLGWLLNIDSLKSILPGGVTQKTNTALGLIASSMALLLWLRQSMSQLNQRYQRWSKGISLGLSGLLIFLGLVTLVEYGLSIDLGINRLAWFEAPLDAVDAIASGRPAPNTAINFVLIGGALWLLNRGYYRAAQGLGALAFFITLLALTGYFYTVDAFYRVGSVTGMAIHTAIAFLLLSLGVLFAKPEQGWMHHFISTYDGGIMMRRLLPLAVVLPMLIGLLVLWLYRQSNIFPREALALRSVLSMALFSMVVWWNGRSLNYIDASRQAIQRRFTETLEAEVAARTAELAATNRALQEENTGRRQAEASLRRSEMRMRQAITFAPFPIMIHAEDGEIVAISQALTEITGYTAAEIPTIADWTERAYGRRQEAGQSTINQLYQLNERVYEGEFTVQTRSGEHRIWEFSSSPLGHTEDERRLVISIASDITQRKQIEMDLEASRTQLQQQLVEIETIYRSAPIGLNVLDPDLRFLRINERLAEINGYSVEEHIGRTVRDLLPDIADTAEALLLPIFETGEPLLNVEIQGETPAQPGVKRIWRESFLPLKDGDRVIGINTVCEEITERRRTELALQEAQAQLEAALVAGAVYTWSWHIPENRVKTTRSFATLFGIDTAAAIVELPVETFLDAIYPEDRAHITAALQNAIATGETYQAEYRICPTTGSERWVLARGQVDYDADDKAVNFPGVLVDITHRKQIETALQDAEDRYRTLFEKMEDGFCVIEVLFNEADQPFDYRFIEVNPAFAQQTGLQHAEGKTALQLVPNLESHWIETYGEIVKTGRPARFESGSEAMGRWFEVSAFLPEASSSHRVAVLFKEISDRKQAEATLANRARQQSEVVRIGQQALAIDDIDTFLNKVVTQVAQTLDVEYCKVLELLPDEQGLLLRAGVGWQAGLVGQAIVGRGLDSQAGYTLLSSTPVVVEDLNADTRFQGPALLTDHGVVSGMSTLIGSKAHPFGVLGVHTRQHRHFTENDVNFLQAIANILSESITQHQTRQEIRQINTHLEHRVEERTQQLTEVNRELEAFAYSIAHDLRAPLRAIEGMARILQEDYCDRLDQVGQEYVQVLIDSAAQLDGLIQDLLTYSRLGRRDVQLKQVSLDVVMSNVLKEVVPMFAQRQPQITVEPMPTVWAQRAVLQQVLTNLLTNALKFVPVDRIPTIHVWAEEHSLTVRIWIEDNGIGIASRHQNRIFRPFERLHGIEQYEGTGIGLAIVERGVTRMGGHVGLESILGEGSRFWIELSRPS